MNGSSTVNIADFRCRGVSRANAFQRRPTRGLHGTYDGNSDLRVESSVYDFAVEAQRLRRRDTVEPIDRERKAKILRFRNATSIQMEIHQMEVRAEQGRHAERWSAMPNGSPHDPPPAA
jgi:hypothetical protein